MKMNSKRIREWEKVWGIRKEREKKKIEVSQRKPARGRDGEMGGGGWEGKMLNKT